MKHYVQISLELLSGACCRCNKVFGPTDVAVKLAASTSRQQIEGGLPPVSKLYCAKCYDRLVGKEGQTWPNSEALRAVAPSGVHTRRCFKVNGDAADPLERFQ